MALKGDFPIETEPDQEILGSGRRRSGRQNYLQMLTGKNSSSLVNQLKLQEESLEKERRRQREKEKKEANQALLQDLQEWEAKELGSEIMDQLRGMWEIPSVGSFLYLVKTLLGIEDINMTEFELSFVYPNKSNLLSRIFTALLITPHQRKSLYKKPPMKFKLWELKLKEKVSSWYKLAEKEGTHSASIQLGIDPAFFDILGKDKNPLEEKSYLDLTLHQRVWLLKTLCDLALNRDYDIRDTVLEADFMEQRDLFLGVDGADNSYLYFPIFQTTDVRIYKHVQLPDPSSSKDIEEPVSPAPPKKPRRSPSKPATPAPAFKPRSSRLRQLRDSPAPIDLEMDNSSETADTVTSGEKEEPTNMNDEDNDENKKENSPEEQQQTPAKCTIEKGFSLACYDIESLRKLCEDFAEPPPVPKKRGRRPKLPPPRKRCEIDLHETFVALLLELEKYEATFSRTSSKAKIKVMKESLEPEPIDEPEVAQETIDEDWGSEASDDDAGAMLDTDDEEFKPDNETDSTDDKKNAKKVDPDSASDGGSEDTCEFSMQTALPRFKKKRLREEENADGCSISIQTPPPKFKKKPKGWSPQKGESSDAVLTALQAGRSPAAVFISAVSAQESVKATTTAADGTPCKLPTTGTVVSCSEIKASIPTSSAEDPQSEAQKDSVGSGVNTVHRKRTLVSPEGQTHEVKAFIESTSLENTTPSQTLKTVMSRTSSAKALIAEQSSQAAASSKKLVMQAGKAVSLSNTVKPATPRPNILSRTKKQTTATSQQVPGSNLASGPFAVSLALSKGSMGQLSSGVTDPKEIATTPSVSSTVSSTTTQPKLGTSIHEKKTLGKVTVSGATPGSKAARASKPRTPSKQTTSSIPVSAKQKIVVVPAASVGPNSPLAGLKPSLINTGTGKKILGYAIVVPDGSMDSVKTLLNRNIAPAAPARSGSQSVAQNQANQAEDGVKAGHKTSLSCQGPATFVPVTQAIQQLSPSPTHGTATVSQASVAVELAQQFTTGIAHGNIASVPVTKIQYIKPVQQVTGTAALGNAARNLVKQTTQAVKLIQPAAVDTGLVNATGVPTTNALGSVQLIQQVVAGTVTPNQAKGAVRLVQQASADVIPGVATGVPSGAVNLVQQISTGVSLGSPVGVSVKQAAGAVKRVQQVSASDGLCVTYAVGPSAVPAGIPSTLLLTGVKPVQQASSGVRPVAVTPRIPVTLTPNAIRPGAQILVSVRPASKGVTVPGKQIVAGVKQVPIHSSPDILARVLPAPTSTPLMNVSIANPSNQSLANIKPALGVPAITVPHSNTASKPLTKTVTSPLLPNSNLLVNTSPVSQTHPLSVQQVAQMIVSTPSTAAVSLGTVTPSHVEPIKHLMIGGKPVALLTAPRTVQVPQSSTKLGDPTGRPAPQDRKTYVPASQASITSVSTPVCPNAQTTSQVSSDGASSLVSNEQVDRSNTVQASLAPITPILQTGLTASPSLDTTSKSSVCLNKTISNLVGSPTYSYSTSVQATALTASQAISSCSTSTNRDSCGSATHPCTSPSELQIPPRGLNVFTCQTDRSSTNSSFTRATSPTTEMLSCKETLFDGHISGDGYSTSEHHQTLNASNRSSETTTRTETKSGTSVNLPEKPNCKGTNGVSTDTICPKNKPIDDNLTTKLYNGSLDPIRESKKKEVPDVAVAVNGSTDHTISDFESKI
ncbi:uncharacterized threonine-rich GPI-anchored glycoprotein PJ4664.02 isoform X3 [Nematostella vectensis]|nr:uncharacterized threonine-rich GPI-anchored glycoprotein PJ4664.02 isoform X2 [Nematostella vectensis]XP_032231600.2 uncharacterized threonine-rich GPI-anchored glycoprotein PJ4664.02 isoform X3 [Nematostella vectensis]